MELMSIYIQVPTIEDHNIVNTVVSAMDRCDNPDSVSIGIACTAPKGFFNEVVKPLEDIKNVFVKRFDPADHRGLGKARINSRFAYDDQDYLIQIDAHTLFQNGWDSVMVNLYEDSLKVTKNNKTLVTSYLGRFNIVDGIPNVIDHWPGYSVWSEKNVTERVPLKWSAVTKISDFPDWVLSDKNQRFYPSNRVAGNFVMGNKEWAKFHGWSGNEVFWEEEVLPAISLLENGFSLVFPNQELPLTHLYWFDDLTRQVMDDIFEDPEDIDDMAIAHIEKYIRENKESCDKYREYSGYDLKTNTITYKVVIPSQYGFKEKL